MKKQYINILTLSITLILLSLFSTGTLKAGVQNDENSTGFKERMKIAESYMGKPAEPMFEISQVYKVYGADFNLVYESYDRQDEKLNALITKSDLITTTNNTHIFQLSR